MATSKGLYKPIHPEKYMGDPNKIRFLSSWEMKFFQFCDANPNVLQWGSEEFKIQYFNPIKKKVCFYFPDIIMKFKRADGVIQTQVIEIKPMKQTVSSSNMSTYDKVQLIINHAKWTAAKVICESHGIHFRVATEHELFGTPLKVKKKK